VAALGPSPAPSVGSCERLAHARSIGAGRRSSKR
jgi:hypothetical protein